jgi:hypothetical protein
MCVFASCGGDANVPVRAHAGQFAKFAVCANDIDYGTHEPWWRGPKAPPFRGVIMGY